jgi:peroxiredoxin 5
MKAWAKSLDADNTSNIRFLGDPSGAFTKAFDTEFDSAKIFGQNRSKRYAATVEGGKVKEVFIEPDNTGLNGKSINLMILPVVCSATLRIMKKDMD